MNARHQIWAMAITAAHLSACAHQRLETHNIEQSEHERRRAALQASVAASEVDAYLVANSDNIYYLFGVPYRPYERPFIAVLRPDAPTTLLVPKLEEVHLESGAHGAELQAYWDYPAPPGEGWQDQLHKILGDNTTVGVEPSASQELMAALTDRQVTVLPLVERARLLKSPDEISMLRQSARYAVRGMQRLIGDAYAGTSVLETLSHGREVQLHMIREIDFTPLVSSALVFAYPAPYSALPHGVPEIGMRLREGPHIAMSVMRVNGYATECERTFFLSQPTPKERAAFEVMREARRRALALVRPGAHCAEIDRAARDFLIEQGYGEFLLHRTGHGFGLGGHEGPWIADGCDTVLEENMVISVEPGIYIPGVGGFRHSDTILVTADSHEVLTPYPTELEALTIDSWEPLKEARGWVVRQSVGIEE